MDIKTFHTLTTKVFLPFQLSFSVGGFAIAGVYFSVHRLREREMMDGQTAPILSNESLEEESEEENKANEEDELKSDRDPWVQQYPMMSFAPMLLFYAFCWIIRSRVGKFQIKICHVGTIFYYWISTQSVHVKVS